MVSGHLTQLKRLDLEGELGGVTWQMQDGSCWTITGGDSAAAEDWTPGDLIEILDFNGPESELSNAETGETVTAFAAACAH